MSTKRQKKISAIYQLKVQLDGTKPPIWRRFLVPNNVTFDMLHGVLQTVMGWDNSHLYLFRIGSKRDGITIESAYDPMGGLLDATFLESDYDSAKTFLADFVDTPKEKFFYEYDFGDSWGHTITLEKVLHLDEVKNEVPVCLDGKLSCPPEDCGGVWGYYNLRAALDDKNSSEHEELLDWMGGVVPNWDAFSLEDVNKELAFFRTGEVKKTANI